MKIEPLTLWFTGLSGAGKTTLGRLVQQALSVHQPCFLLDGDELRQSICKDLGFSPADRAENVRRAASLCRMLNDQGIAVCAAFVSPHASHREEAARLIGSARFREVYLSASLAVCEARDVKGLYRKARRGDVSDLTGLGSAYEIPAAPWQVIDTAQEAPSASCGRILAQLAAPILEESSLDVPNLPAKNRLNGELGESNLRATESEGYGTAGVG